MKNEIIEIGSCKLELSQEFMSDTEKVKLFTKELDALGSIVLDLSSKEKIKEAKELKSKATKFVDALKDACEPWEAAGQRIKDCRSLISKKLNDSNGSVIKSLLAPIKEREELIKTFKSDFLIPSVSAERNTIRIEGIIELEKVEWLGFADETLPLIEQQKNFLLNEKIKFDQEVKAKIEAENLARIERENQIRLEAEVKAKANAQKAIDEANERAKQAEIKVEAIQVAKTPFSPITPSANGVESQKIVHRKILSDLIELGIFDNKEDATNLMTLIYKGKIENLVIKY